MFNCHHKQWNIKNLIQQLNLKELVTDLNFLGLISTGNRMDKSEGFDSVTGLVMLLKLDSNCWYFGLYDLEIRWMTLNKANLRDLIAATSLVILLKIGMKSSIFCLCNLEFDGWARITIGHLFYSASRFVHHFKAISKFKLELQFRNAQFGSKSTIFFTVWPCNLTYDVEKQ